MRVSTGGRYALRAMVDLALHAGKGPVPCRDIAERQEVSDQYLSQLFLRLKQANLVESVRGPGGGYVLAREAAQISARDVLDAVEEPLAPVFCVDEGQEAACHRVGGCPTHWLWERVGQAIRAVLDSVTLADLCTRSGDPVLPASGFSEQRAGAETRESKESPVGLGSPQAAHAFQQSIIDSLTEPIMVIGVDYRVKLVNRAAREFSCAGADAAKAVLCYQISHRREAPCGGLQHPCPLEQVRESGQPVTVVHEHYRANGERRLVELVASPVWAADGTLQGIVESARDVTERVRAEEALQQYAERLRALAARLAEVSEAERQRLAQELHDQVGQNLTALGINLNIVQAQMPPGASAAVRARLDDSLSLVGQTAERIRDVMANLRPPVLDDYGLVAALHWYAEQFARRTDIAIAVEGEDPVPRPAARAENALFRIAQEALTNVAKHAQATHVTVSVEADGKTLRLLVADDGIGFDPADLTRPGTGRGWGMLTMTERAEAVGGRCRIASVPGKGTQVVVEVPR